MLIFSRYEIIGVWNFSPLTMPRNNKRTRHLIEASKKRWKKAKQSPPPPYANEYETSDAEPDQPVETTLDFILEEEEDENDSNDDFLTELQHIEPNALEILINNAKKSDAWATEKTGRRFIYTGMAKSTQRNKRAAWRKAAKGSGNLMNWIKPATDEIEPQVLFDTDEDSDDDNDKFTSMMLGTLLKNSKHVDMRLYTVHQFFRLIEDEGFSKLSASNLLARSLGKGVYHARLIRSWANQWLFKGELAASQRGCHSKIKSLLFREDLKLNVIQYLQTNKFTLTIRQFIKFIEDEAIPALGVGGVKTISETTARRWLKEFGWEYKDHSKDIYFDGHEREDVVAYRVKFLQQMATLRHRMAIYEGDNMNQVIQPTLLSNVLEIVPITHDESVFYANDGVTKTWGPTGESQLRRKSQGLSIHVSDFLCESVGRLGLSEEECRINESLPSNEQLVHTKACVTIYPGINRDGWWKNQDIVNQVVERAIPIFERIHSGKTALFMFDNSSNHNAYADDALVISRMNMKDGGKQPLLRNGKMPDGSPHIMIFTDIDGTIKPKGIKRILQERGLWISGLTRQCNLCAKQIPNPEKLTCCATRILSIQHDFATQKTHLQEVIEAHGHMCIFYPKFHCELNFIESFWGEAKRYCRQHCDYTFKGLKQTISNALDSVNLIKIRRFARRANRYISAYELGLSGKAAIFAVKKYRSHRRVPENVLIEFGNL
jgi:hypothetical protein